LQSANLHLVATLFTSRFECDLCTTLFAVTREHICQIEANALRKLRQPSRFGKLRLFLDDVHE